MPAAAFAGGGLIAGGEVAVGSADDAQLEGDAFGRAPERAFPALLVGFERAGWCGGSGGFGLG